MALNLGIIIAMHLDPELFVLINNDGDIDRTTTHLTVLNVSVALVFCINEDLNILPTVWAGDGHRFQFMIHNIYLTPVVCFSPAQSFSVL